MPRKTSNNKYEHILSEVGLSENSVWDIFYSAIQDDYTFSRYISSSYKDSREQEEDEVYRMHESVILHKDSGLRISYLTTESYYGDKVDYLIKEAFIITIQQKKLAVTSIDLENKIFETSEGTVHFKDVRKIHIKSD